MGSLGEAGGKEMRLNSSNPILVELSRLENIIREKERELAAVQNEIKAYKGSEFLNDKAVMELANEVKKLEDKLRSSEKQNEEKNLQIKKLIVEKKEAISAQFAAEATLRRVHASQNLDDSVSVGTFIAPLEAEIRMLKIENSALQEDIKSMDRFMKTKDASLVEAERNLQGALERALVVENLQNLNYELKRRIEICQEENKFLERTNRQKVTEVEKLLKTICELEECILAGGAAANAVREYRRQIYELNEEKKTLERELSKAKVCANRVAVVVANEWKDEEDKVMPGELQRLRDKLVISERSAKAEARLKDKLQLRLKTLEESFKNLPDSSGYQAMNSENKFGFSSPGSIKRSTSQPRASLASSKLSAAQQIHSTTSNADAAKSLHRSSSLRSKFISSENVLRKSLWASRNKFYDEGRKENAPEKYDSDSKANENNDNESNNTSSQDDRTEDVVSGFLYDRLQREVIILRKSEEEKDNLLSAKEDEIKVDNL
ncbi:Microtubule-associated protein 70-2 [Apostasia shenzhenica]|uniref:Microtubule-associated protein 70-2 n=1 Tax=Apostasia shenzhenica TaxID=1088818 RepID=A0A2I0AZV4_9ASPA|nr:Microtubule-associated protein 70-2 [Apostasia shenzhenica]